MGDNAKEKRLNDIKTILNSLIIPHPRGVSLKTLTKDFKEIEEGEIPYKELGFDSLVGFLQSMPDSIRVTKAADGTNLLFPICNESNEHMIEMVCHQSQKKLKNKTPMSRGSFVKRTSTPMDRSADPRIAKRLKVVEDNNHDSNGWAEDSIANTTHNGNSNNVTPTKPYHQMSEEEAVSIVAAVRKETPKLTTSIEMIDSQTNGKKNGVDTKIWSEIFDVRLETDMKQLPIEAFGMMAQKATLREPMKIGEYSLKINSRGSDRLFLNDASELKYLHLPPPIADVSLDLTHGYEMVSDIHWGKPSETKIDELLKWISLNRQKFMIPGELIPQQLHTDFVCYRGTLTRIMSTPYEKNERWLIGATKFKNTIYLCQFHEEFPPPDDYYNKLSFGGFRFEQYLTSYDPTIPPDPNDFDPDHHEYCVVMRSRLLSNPSSNPPKSHSLAYGAELDAVLPNVMEQPGKLKNFVELKTTKMIQNENQYRSFCKYKLLKWWIQSYLVGVPTIVCGYKDQRNVVKKMEHMSIESFPHLALEFWSANVCLNFLDRTLDYMKEVMTIDDPNVVYLFSYSPNNDIRCKRLLEPEHFQILPKWYIRELSH